MSSSAEASSGLGTPVRRLRSRNSNTYNTSGSDSNQKRNSSNNESLANCSSGGSNSNGNVYSSSPSSATNSSVTGGGATNEHSNNSHYLAEGNGGRGGCGSYHGQNNNPYQHLGHDEKPSASRKYHNSCSQPGLNSARKDKNHIQPYSSSIFDVTKTEEFHFDIPHECPVFRPTPEEFKNPLAYISKIRPIAEKSGIAKILPPEFWSPPFAVDVDKLKFTPRVQRLNELEAKTRVKLNFLDQIAKFWELQGSSLKIPMVERRALDLYTLHRVVQEEGGMEQTTKDRKWARIANRMAYPTSKSVGATLKAHYERILHPFEVYTSGKVLGTVGPSTSAGINSCITTINNASTTLSSGIIPSGNSGAVINTANAEVKLEDGTDYKTHEIPTRQQIAPPNENNARRSKRFANSSASCGLGASKQKPKADMKEEIKRDLLNSFNATLQSSMNFSSSSRIPPNMGVKTPGSSIKKDLASSSSSSNNGSPKKSSTSNDIQMIDPLMKYICHICNRGDVEESMLLCDGCDDSYHTFCLLPPLMSIPKGEWLCPRCVVEEVSKPTEAFGFEQAEREYTLQQFGQMADQFKVDYFRKPVHLVPTDLVEREFWRIVSSIDEDVTVEYGADLHTMDHGSGFPTKSSLYLLPGDQEYAESSWNLNNLPLLEDSILGHINADISGMNAPWMYVGMCFATFCWHIEDHWSYSINYLHWGEPKTWYGVPGGCAEQFEDTMKRAAPELFASQPDLLHQLVTIMNPNILMNNGVPVYRTDQNAGEFVITFPRAYHAGFNQGYNFAEAVNFAPADWLKMGRECINHYSTLRRFCVFSHDELVCKMALEPAKLTFGIATACYIDMVEMVDSEKKLRKSLLEWGVTRAERKAFELIQDDERHCQECNTTCFLSAVSCDCTKAIVCLRHYTELCHCSPEKHTLLYRYTLDEMPLMLQKLKSKAQSFERWLSRCRDIVDANTPTSVTFAELQELCKEAEVKRFPSSLLIDRLNAAVLEAEKCVTVIQQLGINKVRTRSDNNAEVAQYRLTMEELSLFVQEIDNLCCIIEEGASVHELYTQGKQYINRANEMLNYSLDTLDELELERIINEGTTLRIELEEIYQLNLRMKQLKWYKRSQGLRIANTKLRYEDIKSLLHIAAAEVPPRDVLITKEINKLQEIGASIEAWENQANKYFNCTVQRYELTEIEQFLKTAADIEGQLPSYNILKDALNQAQKWLKSVEELQDSDHFPYCHVLEAIVLRGRSIPIQLEELVRMQGHLNSAQEWKENAEDAFLKKNTYYSLLEILMPRSEPVTIDTEKKKPFQGDFVKDLNPAQIVESFKTAEEKELYDMRQLRLSNLAKNQNPSNNAFCLCKSSFQGIMHNCHLCYDWFHENCVEEALVSSDVLGSVQPPPLELKNNQQHNVMNSPSINTDFDVASNNNSSSTIGYGMIPPKWLCPSCVRSKRPRLETILPLLVSLQTLPIRLPEDEALRCLAERAMNWQERARKTLLTPNVAEALNIVNQEAQQLQQQTQKQQQCGYNYRSKSSRNSFSNINNSSEQVTSNGRRKMTTRITTHSDNLHDSNDDEDVEDNDRLYNVEDNHNSEAAGDDENATNNGNQKYDGSRRRLSQVHRLLTESEREHLDDLMMEGNLLEVSLDEILEVWRLISVFQPNNNTEAAILANRFKQANNKKHRQNQILQNSASSNVMNYSLDDSSDSLLTQSSPGSSLSGGGGSSNRNSVNTSGGIKRRRHLESVAGSGGGSVPRKKVTPNKHLMSRNSPGSELATSTPIQSNRKYTKRADLMKHNSEENVSNVDANIIGTYGLQQQQNVGHNSSQKRQKKRGNSNFNSNNSNSNGNSDPNSASGGGGGGVGQKKSHASRAQIAQDDDEEECRAENCHKPTGREVDWVQCDGGCNEWFHMYCVGLNRNQIKADDDYICLRCSKKIGAASAGVPTTSVNHSTSSTNNNNCSVHNTSKSLDTAAVSIVSTGSGVVSSNNQQQQKGSADNGGVGGKAAQQSSR